MKTGQVHSTLGHDMKAMFLGFFAVFAIAYAAYFGLTEVADFSSGAKYSGQAVRME
jgi:hypothetical protein